MTRQLVAAIAISLCGHAALIGVLGVLPEPVAYTGSSTAPPVTLSGVQSSTRVILSAPGTFPRVPSPPMSGFRAAVPDTVVSPEINFEASVPVRSPPADSLLAGTTSNPGFADSPGQPDDPGQPGDSGLSESPYQGLDSDGQFQAGVLPGPGLLNTPPAPANTVPVLLSSFSPDYPLMARRSGLEGEVIIEIAVGPDGTPTDYRVMPPRSHRILEEAAVRAVKNARFQPGTRNGQPAACTYSIKVRFELSPENA